MTDVVAGGHRLEVVRIGPASGPTLVLLHEGLGCARGWRDYPERLQEATGLGVLAYSRWGYGASAPVTPPRPLTYMHDEATGALPELLDACGIDDAILVGHSDGGSIAIVFAGSGLTQTERLRGLVLEAPHVFVEDLSVKSIAEAREAYLHGDLRQRLLRRHGDNVDGAFWGWNRAWLDPGFRAWNLEEYLPRIRVPALVVQGQDDPYGTLAQVESIATKSGGPVSRLVLPRCGHAPHREQTEATVGAVRDFVAALLRG